MDQNIVDKIMKCLSMAESADYNPHEAENAMRIARKLCDQYNLDFADIEAERQGTKSDEIKYDIEKHEDDQVRQYKRWYKDKEEAKKVAGLLTDAVNNFSPGNMADMIAEEICCRTHNTLQQNTMRVIIAIIGKWAEMYDKGYYDARNEATVKLAKGIMTKVNKEDFYLPMI